MATGRTERSGPSQQSKSSRQAQQAPASQATSPTRSFVAESPPRSSPASPHRAGLAISVYGSEADQAGSPTNNDPVISPKGRDSNATVMVLSPLSLKGTARWTRHTPSNTKLKTVKPSRPRSAVSDRMQNRTSLAYDRTASPQRRFHFPTRWSAKSGRPSSCRSNYMREAQLSLSHAPDLEPDSHQPKLLESLGLAPLASDLEFSHDSLQIAACLPSFAPHNLEQCEESCYWHWLVYTLMGDVDELRRCVRDTEEELRQRAEQRREVEEVIGNRDKLVDDLERMEEDLEILRVDVPAGREEFHSLQKELENWRREHQEILEKQEEVRIAIARSRDWQNANAFKARDAERDVEVIQIEERLMKDQITSISEEFNRLEIENKTLGAERDALREEVNMLEEARHGVKKQKSAGLSGKAKAKAKAVKKR